MPTDTAIYTAISFAPVQSFIEKSRKLRDLYGASRILSELSLRLIRGLIKTANESPQSLELIQPHFNPSQSQSLSLRSPNLRRGVPNSILFRGSIDRSTAKKVLCESWREMLIVCQGWIEQEIPLSELRNRIERVTHTSCEDLAWRQPWIEQNIPLEQYYWEKEWQRWQSYAWELFWGQGENPPEAMQRLETCKLKRDWVAINWMGESSSILGTDAIAWHRLGDTRVQAGSALVKSLDEKQQAQLQAYLKEEQKQFYYLLACRTEGRDPENLGEKLLEGKFIDPQERLSIPELVKRLITYKEAGDQEPQEQNEQRAEMRSLGLALSQGFKEIQRKAEEVNGELITGKWTGWFMGDGDKMGNYLKVVYQQQGEAGLQETSQKLIRWGRKLGGRTRRLGKVVYAGGDDFLGVMFSRDRQQSLSTAQVVDWLVNFPKIWQQHELPAMPDYPKPGREIAPTVSMGFVWVAPSVPQRDVLQHCREAQKEAKRLGRDRVTLRVVFNSGQFVQWTCPWQYLGILEQYRDRDGVTWQPLQNSTNGSQSQSVLLPNWSHIYTDWEHLKARHAVRLQDKSEPDRGRDDLQTAIALFNYYFDDQGDILFHCSDTTRQNLTGDISDLAIIKWINDLIQVGWQLCSNLCSNT